jgi:hypothetical protein
MIKDTNYGMTWDDYMSLLKDLGFQYATTTSYAGRSKDVLVKEDEGLLIVADKYDEFVNRTELHYELDLGVPYHKLTEAQKIGAKLILADASHSVYAEMDQHVFPICVSARSGLVRHLGKLRNSEFQVNAPWQRLDDNSNLLINKSLQDAEGLSQSVRDMLGLEAE